jgi:hypothetical protein
LGLRVSRELLHARTWRLRRRRARHRRLYADALGHVEELLRVAACFGLQPGSIVGLELRTVQVVELLVRDLCHVRVVLVVAEEAARNAGRVARDLAGDLPLQRGDLVGARGHY